MPDEAFWHAIAKHFWQRKSNTSRPYLFPEINRDGRYLFPLAECRIGVAGDPSEYLQG
jgi:hypothetical protein